MRLRPGSGQTFTLKSANVWGLDLSGSFQGAGGVGGLLKQKRFTNRGMERQKVFTVAFRMKRITMVIGVTRSVIKRVPPTQKAEQIEKEYVEWFGFENRAVPEFMRSSTAEKTGNATPARQAQTRG